MSKQKINEDEILDALPFLEDVEQAGIQELQRFGIYSLIPKNQFITMEGDSCQFFSFVLSGKIKVYKTAEKLLCIVYKRDNLAFLQPLVF